MSHRTHSLLVGRVVLNAPPGRYETRRVKDNAPYHA
jgi:hypothetical protein